jgi:hypothetical protein
MTFATITNLVLGALCVIVVIQSLRMVRGVQEIRSLSLDESVAQLDRATDRAQMVLTELKRALESATTAQNRAIVDGEALRDELSVMVGIGNAVAERIMEAAEAQNPKLAAADEPDAPQDIADAQQPKATQVEPRSQDRRGRSRHGGNRNGSAKMMEPIMKSKTVEHA